MPTLHLLGTGAAVSEPHRTTTMLAFEAEDDTLVVDCGGDVVQRLLAAGIDLDSISALYLTHEHPDHVSGFPLFMEKIWLAGRRRPIPVFGIAPALAQARRCFDSFDTSSWTDMPEIVWHEVSHREGTQVLADETWRVTASPGRHGVPVVGLRVQHVPSRAVVAYSCDTEPSGLIMRLSDRAHILVHEATGQGPGHSSAEQAAEVAREAEARRLLLVHLPPGAQQMDLGPARRIFPLTELGVELGAYPF